MKAEEDLEVPYIYLKEYEGSLEGTFGGLVSIITDPDFLGSLAKPRMKSNVAVTPHQSHVFQQQLHRQLSIHHNGLSEGWKTEEG